MQTTLKQQIEAVNQIRLHGFSTNPATADKQRLALNDAASTIATVRLIGEKQILIAPEIISTVRAYCADKESGAGTYLFYQKFQQLLKRLD